MSAPAADSTRTLSVYAWLDASGTAAIAKGRQFKEIGTAATAGIFERGAWTAMLKSNATFITGRDYQATFEPALPQGTDLTLTVLSSGQTTYYHYTLGMEQDSVNFSEFTKMGTTGGTPPEFTDSGTEESFLLSADFGELADGSAPTDGTVSFSVLPGDGTPIVLGGDVHYTVTGIVNGEITATADTVTVSTPPSGDERRSGKTLYLVGTLSGTDGAPLDAEASLTAGTTINGRWLDGDTVAFELGSYGSLSAGAYTFQFEALRGGTYTVTWRLCAGEAPNMLGGVCSNEESSGISVAAQSEPRLTVTCEQVSRVLAAGTAHSLSFTYKTNASPVTVTVEKQSVLANFREVSGTEKKLTTASGTVSTEIPADAGTYRVRFSIAEGSRNDDVYYSFIVE